MTLFPFLRLHNLAALIVAAALAACATVPKTSDRPYALTAQPLQRIEVTQNTSERDVLAGVIAGEFALVDMNVDAGAHFYADAARVSEDPAVAEQATHVAIASRQWDIARATLARWQALQGDDVGIRQARAMLALHDDNADAAYADLAFLAQQPDGIGWRAVSQALLNVESKLQAGAMLERLLRMDGKTTKAVAPYSDLLGPRIATWIAVSQMALRLERKDLAQTLADQAVLRFHNADAYAWAAQLKLSDGDKVGARKLFADALRNAKTGSARSPQNESGEDDNLRLRVAYAKLLGDLGENASAAQVLAQGRQTDYTYAARAAYLARSEDKTEKPLIEILYREVLALASPRSPARSQLLGQLAELLEQKAEALKWYAQVPGDDEHWFGAQVRTAVLLDATGKTADSLNLLHELQARSGDDPKQLGDAFTLEAELLNRHKRGDEAVAVYDRGLQALPDDSQLIYARALLNDDLGHVDAAVSDLRRVLELKPDDAEAMNALGYTLADRTDQKTEALALIEKALALKPGEPAIIDSLGWVQYRLGNLDAAVEQLRNAFAKQPDPEIAAHLGEVLWVSGRKDEARQVWEQGRKKDGDNKVLLETIRRLTS